MKPSSTSDKSSKQAVSSEQKNAFVELVVNAVRKIAAAIVDELVQSGVINVSNLQRVLARGNEIIEAVNTAVREKVAEIAENIVDRVKLISGATVIEIGATDGTETIAGARDVFTGYLERSFKDSNTSAPTQKAPVQVYEMIKDGSYNQIFGGMSDDLNKLCLTEHQIKRFVQTHHKWLRTDGYGTFFLYKEGDEFFVAHVSLHSDGPDVGRNPLSHGSVWYAEGRRRIVVPQLALGN